MTIIFLIINVSSKVSLRRKTLFAAAAGSPEVNGGISIMQGT